MSETLRTVASSIALALGAVAVGWVVWRLRKDRAEEVRKWED